MKLLMISGDRSLLQGKQGAFWYTLEAFSKHWERIDIICPRAKDGKTSSGGPHETVELFGNVHVHPSPTGLWRQSEWIMEKGAELIRIYGHAVMTVHEYPPFYNGRGAIKLSKRTGVPCVLEIHHIIGHPIAADIWERVGYAWSRLYFPRAAKKARAIRTVSKHAAETLFLWGVSRQKVSVVPSFYLDRNLPASIGAAPQKQFDVAFCARLVPNKGLKSLIRAVAALKNVTLLVIGDGPERPSAEKLAKRLKVDHRVEFRGWLPTQRDVMRAILSAKVLVMNSTSEGGPRVPLEAMSCGMPVIVTKVGVMPDVIINEKNGIFTTGKSVDVAAKIQMLLSDEPLRNRIAHEATGITERFERQKLINGYAHFLQTVAREHLSGR